MSERISWLAVGILYATFYGVFQANLSNCLGQCSLV